jgi:hypothetical protein
MTTAGRKSGVRHGMARMGAYCVAAIVVGIVAAFCAPPPVARAQVPATPMIQANGSVIRLPSKRPFSRMSGLSISVDPRWTNSFGYWPVEVTISSSKATTSDHTITIRIHNGWDRNQSVEQDFVFPSGSKTATAWVTLPVFQTPLRYFWWEVRVDGIRDKDLSMDRKSPQAWTGNASGTAAGLVFLVAGPNKMNRGLVSTSAMELEVLSLTLSTFPTKWIDYSAFDVVSLSRSEVQQLATKQPAAWDAICRWVRAGGSLWISDAGKTLEHLPEISKIFNLPSDVDSEKSEVAEDEDGETKTADKTMDNKSEDDADQPKVQVGWRSLRFRNANSDGKVVTFLHTRTGTRQTIRDADVIARMQTDPNYMVVEERFDPTGAAIPERRSARDSSKWFVEQNLGLGTVRAFRGANEVALFPLTPAIANANAAATPDTPDELPPALTIGMRRTQRWDARHGMTPDSANTEFAKFLVPGVGLAPVSEFRILITLFVLLIGPLNYWWLKRAKRLHLMVLTVPLAAAVTTAGLFAYAIVADGFDTRVRAHSYTRLDQRSGDAVCWTRLSYYAGLSPGKGLTIPADIAMYPILPAWAGDWSVGEQRDLVWDANEARLTQGWLNSRTPTQYLSVRSRKSPHHVEVLDSGDKLRVKNLLGVRIKTLLVVNDAGKIYLGENAANDSSTALVPIARDDAARLINRLVVDAVPQAPAELGASDIDFAALQSRSRFYGRFGMQHNGGRLSENLAGSALMDLAGLTGRPALELLPRSYVAITETGPEVELGISYAKEEASFHLIEGRY